jgi:hypothetical protein
MASQGPPPGDPLAVPVGSASDLHAGHGSSLPLETPSHCS